MIRIEIDRDTFLSCLFNTENRIPKNAVVAISVPDKSGKVIKLDPNQKIVIGWEEHK